MIISPFTPIFFDVHRSDGIESRYIQVFAPSDHILLECLCTPEEEFVPFEIAGVTDSGRIYQTTLKHNSWEMGNGVTLRFCVISGLPQGTYQIRISAQDIFSHFFRITSDPEVLRNTTLIQYSMKDNAQRQDAVFIIDGMRYFFDFRVPGGFKDSGWTFSVDNEQFVDSNADLVELFSLESTQKKFTMGLQEGVPVYFAEMLNRLLTCSYVYFDGIRYARKDSAVPEMNIQTEGVDSFVFTQLLQRINNLDPTLETSNHIIMRRVNSTDYRSIAHDEFIHNRNIQ